MEGNDNASVRAKATGKARVAPIYANRDVPKEAGVGGNNVKISATRKGGDKRWGHGRVGGGKSMGSAKSSY
jgi:hypothetical protein|tara:strand:+ start:4878 stop:5090 length:213 start_codon:yes stop_codon:yes gene_type:complete